MLLCTAAWTACRNSSPTPGSGSGVAASAASAGPASPAAEAGRWCEADDEDEALGCSRARAWRSGDTLFVRVDSGPLRSYVTRVPRNPDDDSVVRWEYVGALTGRHGAHHLLRQRLYEESGLTLVSERSGRAVHILRPPVPSPDGAHFVSVSQVLHCETSETGFDLWRMTDSLPVREIELRPFNCSSGRGWGPSEPTWHGTDTLRFLANEVLPYDHEQAPDSTIDGLPVRRHRALLVRTADGWTFVGIPEPKDDSDEER